VSHLFFSRLFWFGLYRKCHVQTMMACAHNAKCPQNTCRHLWSCLDLNELNANTQFTPNPWGCHVVVTAGFVLVLAMAIPCGIFNLDDNMWVQVTAFILTLGCWIVWIIAAFFAAPQGGWSLEACVNLHTLCLCRGWEHCVRLCVHLSIPVDHHCPTVSIHHRFSSVPWV
jgi:hypothetical protein